MNVLLIHGFLDTGRLFRRLESRLAAAGHRCFAPTLTPRDGRRGLADLAGKLAGYIDSEMPGHEPFAVVGFSMGCLVARYYLQQMQGCRRVRTFFAISGPMHGTATAFLYPGKGTRDMRPGSRFLRELDASAGDLNGLPVHIYYTPFDLMIIPATSSRMAGARALRVSSPLHRWVLANREVIGDILRTLNRLETEKNSIRVKAE